MSIIDVKGTRSKETSLPPQGRDRFEDKPETRNSQVPVYVGTAISAVLLYLKSSLDFGAQAKPLNQDQSNHHRPSDSNHSADEQKLAGDGDFNPSGQPAEITAETAPPASRTFNHSQHRTIGDQFARPPLGASHGPDSLDAQHSPNLRTGFRNSGEAMSFPAFPTNDNRVGQDDNAVAAAKSAGSGGSANSHGQREPTHKVNHAPVVSGRVKLGTEFTNTNLAILVASLLGNAKDADADKLSVKDVRINGVLLHHSHGAYTYHGTEIGPVVINYLVSDGKLSVAASAELILKEPPLSTLTSDSSSTARSAQITSADVIQQIDSTASIGPIYGENENTTLTGGDRNDVIFGGSGDDIIFGGNGDDALHGGQGNDIIYGEAGNDLVFGDAGNDTLYDGKGQDTVDGGDGNDTVIASADAENDTFEGGAGTNTLSYKLATSDLDFDMKHQLVSGADIGQDQAADFQVLEGGSGNDIFHAALIATSAPILTPMVYRILDGEIPTITVTPAADTSSQTTHESSNDGLTYIGGEGTDTLDYSAAEHSLTVNTSLGTAVGQDIGTDSFSGMERIIGGSGDDVFIFGERAVLIDGAGGADVFQYMAPAQALSAGETAAHIEGFETGDRVRMSMYDLFDRGDQNDTDMFADVYSARQDGVTGEADHDLVAPIRIRFETLVDHFSTYIDADLDQNGSYEVTVELDGNHHLTIINNHIG